MHSFSAALWQMPGAVSWVLLTVPEEVSDRIREVPREPRPGFGSLRVEVTMGTSVWKTSIFPEANSGPYVLPVKKAVRQAQAVEPPDVVDLTIELLE